MKLIMVMKQVQTLFESLFIIGNIFNIILIIFKVINSYYSNKILFVDIFKTVFFDKDNININFKENIHLNNHINLNENNSLNKKKNLDLSHININKSKVFLNI